MRRYKRTLVAVALATTVVTGTAGWASGTAQRAVTGPPPGTAAWVAEGRPDPERATPAQVAAYFARLGPEEARQLARRHPSVVGNLDGAPPALRYAANADALRRDGRFPALERERVLAFDPRGRGQFAVVLGDPDRSRHLAVLVPGSDVDAGRGGSVTDKARALRAAAPDTAVIAWAGYTTPVGVGLDAATGDLAEAGADRLARFAGGLAATGAPTPSYFCHSYGSVVCGLAAHRLKAKDLVVFGSPGMRADRAADLGTDARVWAAKDATDWISKVPHVEFAGLGHGTDPTDPAFGARRVPAAGARGHDGYFAPGTDSLRTFAAIARGALK
ncbi:alpha/beta hydrolase [Streptomyces sp. NPDC001941]|uniref:alpha/beta hydrolase n=1 Tax=Streptomyces sp. NPDC001941 TaxID=3154659 RepID=UPI00332B6E4F